MVENNFCVYMHKNKINNKNYIGITNNVKNRWRASGKGYKNYDTNIERPFYNAILKYGWDNFEHIILKENLSFEDACKQEIDYIKKFKTRIKKYGYNIAEGGNGGKIYKIHPRGMLGKHHSTEKKEQQSLLMKQLNAEGKTGAVWKDGHPKGMKDKIHKSETKKQISDTMKNKNVNCKMVCITYPNNEKIFVKSATEASKRLGVHCTFIYKMIKRKTPFILTKSITCNRENFKKIVGCTFQYTTENTEITN